jgi:SAM-dependent methyltransferase
MSRPFEPYDRRHYPTVDVLTGYAEWAETYDRVVDDALDLALLECLGSVDWAASGRALDLACGTGRVGRWLRAHGARVVDGFDLSAAMLQLAPAKDVYAALARAEVTRCPAATRTYILIACGLAACHLPDLGALYREAARLARPGGHFVLLDYHPFFLLNGIPTHFKRTDGEPLAILNRVHLFSDHVEAARTAGWTLRELRERVVDAAWVARVPAMERHLGQPISFVFAWEKA